jgi:Spy/CpxP family protein refolding chaperone
MNKLFRYTAILGALLVATSSFAQLTKAKSGATLTQQKQVTPKNDPGYLMSASEMTRELKLDKSQSEKLASAEAELNEQLRSIENLPAEEREAKTAKMIARHRQVVASVLTPEQNKRLDEISRKRVEERKAGKPVQTMHN